MADRSVLGAPVPPNGVAGLTEGAAREVAALHLLYSPCSHAAGINW
jgi:hypothetical protein